MLTETLYGVLAGIGLLYAVDYCLSLGDDSKEPPRARTTIPLVGHLLGLIRNGIPYYDTISPNIKSEMYTIGIFNFKIYVVNARRLIQPVQRAGKTVSFTKFQGWAAQALGGCSQHMVDLHSNPDFMHQLETSTRTALAPGPFLDDQNLRTANSLQQLVDSVAVQAHKDGQVKLGLNAWIKHMIMIAATDGVYGTQRNPFKDPSLEGVFWDWNDGLSKLVAGMPNFLNRKCVNARKILVEKFADYIRSEPQDCAQVVSERIRVMREFQALEDDIVRMTMDFSIATIPNTTTTAFWVIFYFLREPSVVADVRKEIEDITVTRDGDRIDIDVAALKQQCPLLLSVLEEGQRIQHEHANIRAVMKDTYLDDGKILVKEGSYVQIPNRPIHYDKDIWGSDVSEYNAYRFVKSLKAKMGSEKEGGNANKLPSYAFLAWGTAPHLCPARQFASTEILVMIALIVLRLDIKPAAGKWIMPPSKNGDLAVIMPPKKDVDILVSLREGWNGQYSLKMGASTSRVPLASD